MRSDNQRVARLLAMRSVILHIDSELSLLLRRCPEIMSHWSRRTVLPAAAVDISFLNCKLENASGLLCRSRLQHAYCYNVFTTAQP